MFITFIGEKVVRKTLWHFQDHFIDLFVINIFIYSYKIQILTE